MTLAAWLLYTLEEVFDKPGLYMTSLRQLGPDLAPARHYLRDVMRPVRVLPDRHPPGRAQVMTTPDILFRVGVRGAFKGIGHPDRRPLPDEVSAGSCRMWEDLGHGTVAYVTLGGVVRY